MAAAANRQHEVASSFTPGASNDDASLMNCHFSLNQTALWNMFRPLVADMIQETQTVHRLSYLETTMEKVQASIEHKADAKSLRDTHSMMQESHAHTQTKADQKSVNDVKGILARMEEALTWKADRADMEELSSAVQRCNQVTSAKADLVYVNRTNAALQRVTQTAAQSEKTLVELTMAIQKLEGHHLPQTVQRTRELLTKTSASVKMVQEALTSKAEQRELEDLAIQARDLRAALPLKANQQALLELRAAVNDAHHQIVLKADQLALDDHHQELRRLGQAQQVDPHDFRETRSTLSALQQNFHQKADADMMVETRTRMEALEAALARKAERQELCEVSTAVKGLHDGISVKADRQTVGEVSQLLERVRKEVGQKAEATAHNDANETLERIRNIAERKADWDGVAQRFDELDRKIESVVEQLRRKADYEHLVDTNATVSNLLASGLSPAHASSNGLGAERFSPASSNCSTSTLASTLASSTCGVANSRSPFAFSAGTSPGGKLVGKVSGVGTSRENSAKARTPSRNGRR